MDLVTHTQPNAIAKSPPPLVPRESPAAPSGICRPSLLDYDQGFRLILMTLSQISSCNSWVGATGCVIPALLAAQSSRP